MASTLPNLTWQRTNTYTPASSSSIPDAITAINSCITATDWVIHASASDYILFGPPTGSAIEDMRLLIAGDTSSAPNAAQMDGTHSSSTNRLYIGIAPESGKTALTNVWTSASNPFDTDRFSGFAKFSNAPSSAAIDNLYAIYSDEVFSLFLWTSSTDDMRGFTAGAFIEPPDDNDGEGTPGRVYGYAASGESLISNNFNSDTSQFFGDNTNQNNQTRVWLPSATTTQTDIEKVPISSNAQPRYTTVGGSTFFLPILVHREASGFNMIGIIRQVGIWSDAQDMQIIQDSGSNDKAYLVGSQRNSNADVVAFYNKS